MTIVILIAITCVALSIYGTVHFSYRCAKWGNEYYELAKNSPDIDNAVLYLTKYKEAIEINNFNVGNAGLVFKTGDRDMGNRYAKLLQGIDSLKQVKEQTKLTGSDFNIYSDMKTYVESLNVSIPDYQTANNGWYCFLYIHSVWVSLFVAWGLIAGGQYIIYWIFY